jgi:hypothetical protein
MTRAWRNRRTRHQNAKRDVRQLRQLVQILTDTIVMQRRWIVEVYETTVGASQDAVAGSQYAVADPGTAIQLIDAILEVLDDLDDNCVCLCSGCCAVDESCFVFFILYYSILSLIKKRICRRISRYYFYGFVSTGIVS